MYWKSKHKKNHSKPIIIARLHENLIILAAELQFISNEFKQPNQDISPKRQGIL